MLKLNLDNIKDTSFSITLERVGFTQSTYSYYLAIDRGLLPDLDNTYKVLINLKLLVANWIDCVKSVFKNNSPVIYLPFDFSDQYLGCLRVKLLPNGALKLDFGSTREITGYSINPSQIKCLNEDIVRNYERTSDSFECNHEELLTDLNRMIVLVDVQINTFELMQKLKES